MKSQCLFVILIFASACAALLVRQESCEPDCFGKPPGEKVPDPVNCTNFYICLGNDMQTEVPLPCGSDESFDPSTAACGPGSDCVPVCEPVACHLTCNGTLDVIADANNCSIYHICKAGGGILETLSCPAHLPVFDGENCITDKSRCCKDLCTPYCFPGMIQIPDPMNCTNYYICLEEGLPDPNFHFPCGPGQHFDVTLGMCSLGTDCSAICPTTGGGATTTTSPPVVGDCVSSLTCTATGFFPQCTTCQPGYFQCSAVGQLGVPQKCSGNLVFNTVPSYPFCVRPNNCPYTPTS